METPRPLHDNIFVRNATAIAIGAVTVLMVLAAAMFWRQEQASSEAKRWVVHTYEVRAHIKSLSGALRDAVIGQREFLATGDDDDLVLYQEALRDTPSLKARPAPGSQDTSSASVHRSIRQELAEIRQLTSDNPAQQGDLDDLESVLNPLLSDMAATIRDKQAQPRKSLADFDLHHEKTLMTRAHLLLQVMEAEESHLLALRTEADEINARQTATLIFSGILIFYAVISLAIWLYQRSRARATAQILLYTAELERREEELKMQQEELKASNEEIEAANEEMEEKTKALEAQNAQIQAQSEELIESKRLADERARDVENASKYKSEFLANMSHELRTPLNSLLILARLLAANEDGNLTAAQVEEATIIYNGGLELLSLINDILDLSKVEAGKLGVTLDDTPVADLVARLQQQFAPIVRQKNLAFPVIIEPGVPDLLFTDGHRVEQILKNLLSNAFKFTETGSVTLQVRRPDPNRTPRSSLDYNEAVAFSVIDTGIGIEPSKFKDIFEAFQQENGSIDRHYGGTGLGLTISRKFAQLLGGEIHVTSTKGEGSCFTLVLPLRSAAAGAEIAARPSPQKPDGDNRPGLTGGLRTLLSEFIPDDRKQIGEGDRVLLIIEDDPNFAAAVMKIARRRGYKCLCAGDGKSGLILALEQPVTAILLDLHLPDIGGLAVLDQLKHNLHTRHIPVHIISADDPEAAIAPLRKGAIGFLAKPAAPEALDGMFVKIESLLSADIKKVLVIEDDANTQLAIQSLLRKRDVEIIAASHGEGSLELLRQTRFDCVILDLRLPDMTGFEWLARMEKQTGAGEAPPVVVYTAQDLTEAENRDLNRYTGSIVIKGAKSPERLLDEVTLFLHSVEATLSGDQMKIIRMQHNPDKVLHGRTILLVDDDLRNTFALSKLLKAHGVNIVIADNGQMALEKLAEDTSIELVIMDIMMPVMDGYQAMHEIRARPAFAELPIIALTARAMPEEQEKCMAAGANDYLTKPVDIERLLTLLRVWLFQQEQVA